MRKKTLYCDRNGSDSTRSAISMRCKQAIIALDGGTPAEMSLQ